jgi:hypothetical protein
MNKQLNTGKIRFNICYPHQSDLNGCCTAMWKATRKTATLYFSWIVCFQDGDIIYASSAWEDGRQEDEEEDVGGC